MKRITVRYLWALILLTAVTSGLHASIEKPVERKQLRVVGAGQLTWWGMTVYDAALLSPGGTYHADYPYAIKITYRFGFSQEQLARKSLEEIERIHGRMVDRAATLEVLKGVFRDVAKGDHILGIHYPGQGAEFYSDDRLLGRIEDAALAAAFFSIWLDPATREPGLRAQMLGYRQ